MKGNKKTKKWQLYTAIGAASIIIISAAGILLFRQPSQAAGKDDTSHLVVAKEGTVASSVLLSGTVTAKNEQYVYLDDSEGYDDGAQGSSVSSIDSQISDARDSRADAEAQLKKAQAQLDATKVLSTLEGTVVEVNHNVSKSTTTANQVMVHVVSNDNLQVKGELSEYNLANLSVDQEVTFSSKVYQDKTWTGKISYISAYPKNSGEGTNAITGGNTGSKYPYTIEVTSEIGDLKPGFTVSVEVKSDKKSILVPLTSVITEDGKNYVWVVDEENKAKKVEVSLGNADAENQEITSGLTDGTKVISNPTTSLEEGKEVKADETTN